MLGTPPLVFFFGVLLNNLHVWNYLKYNKPQTTDTNVLVLLTIIIMNHNMVVQPLIASDLNTKIGVQNNNDPIIFY
jgi:hypothetical protein